MSFKSIGYVTDVPYVHVFTRQLAPAWLDHVALVAGFAPPVREEGFAWCDLGCGQGFTAMVLAAANPSGRFCGIDVMSEHIDEARQFAVECKINNIDFHAADFAAAADMSFEGFDYIVTHGVYSWIEKQAQTDLRRFIDRHLKPGGLVYVSYYAMPGRAADLPFQRLVRAIGRTLPGDNATACASAIEIVNKFTALKAPALVASPMASQLNEHPETFPVAYLAHEYMAENWDAIRVLQWWDDRKPGHCQSVPVMTRASRRCGQSDRLVEEGTVCPVNTCSDTEMNVLQRGRSPSGTWRSGLLRTVSDVAIGESERCMQIRGFGWALMPDLWVSRHRPLLRFAPLRSAGAGRQARRKRER